DGDDEDEDEDDNDHDHDNDDHDHDDGDNDGDNDGDRKDDEKQETKGETQAKPLTLVQIQNKLVKIYDIQCYRMEESGFEDSSINVLGKEFQSLGDISLEDVEKWY